LNSNVVFLYWSFIFKAFDICFFLQSEDLALVGEEGCALLQIVGGGGVVLLIIIVFLEIVFHVIACITVI